MEITICSTDKDSLEIIIDAMAHKGFECGEIYSKRRYWLFGKITYCADLESIIIAYPIRPGGVCVNKDELLEHLNSIPFIDAFKAGENLRDMLRTLNSETVPTQLQYLETLEQKQVQYEDFEKAAVTRDKINELKQQNTNL